MLFDILQERKIFLESISLNRNFVNDAGMKSLGQYIQSNPLIKSVNLSCNQITDKGIEALYPYLIGNVSLKCLLFCGNQMITNASAPYLMNVLESSQIEAFDIEDTCIKPKNFFVWPLALNALRYGASVLHICYT